MRPFIQHANLTDPGGIRDAVVQSHEGQAHFAGTGPEGVTCRHCQHWNEGRRRTFGNAVDPPQPRQAACQRFRELCPRIKPKAFPGEALSCKWYVAWVQQFGR